jgi:hypothetical protein
MEDKQKVTLYLPPQLHRQLKIRSAVDADSMSNIVEKAVGFYLNHSEVVDGIEVHGTTHQVYNCPECEHPVVIRDGEMVALGQKPGLLSEDLADLRQDEIAARPCGRCWVNSFLGYYRSSGVRRSFRHHL